VQRLQLGHLVGGCSRRIGGRGLGTLAVLGHSLGTRLALGLAHALGGLLELVLAGDGGGLLFLGRQGRDGCRRADRDLARLERGDQLGLGLLLDLLDHRDLAAAQARGARQFLAAL